MTTSLHRFRLAAVLAAALAAAPAAGQIVTDGSVGDRVSLTGDLVRIEDGLGRRSGGNLLHSFERFNTNAGQTALFGVPDGVDTVIGRVTGGEASRLDGRVSFVDPAFAAPRAADFWFFNPAGVLIGPDAEFRTSGALRFSGGDGMIFADGARLTANLAD
ncbi:MAG: filamentous hemagglutinin N-terminal domain-containing protein, partial [Pseudomonadota bacterium]